MRTKIYIVLECISKPLKYFLFPNSHFIKWHVQNEGSFSLSLVHQSAFSRNADEIHLCFSLSEWNPQKWVSSGKQMNLTLPFERPWTFTWRIQSSKTTKPCSSSLRPQSQTSQTLFLSVQQSVFETGKVWSLSRALVSHFNIQWNVFRLNLDHGYSRLRERRITFSCLKWTISTDTESQRIWGNLTEYNSVFKSSREGCIRSKKKH